MFSEAKGKNPFNNSYGNPLDPTALLYSHANRRSFLDTIAPTNQIMIKQSRVKNAAPSTAPRFAWAEKPKLSLVKSTLEADNVSNPLALAQT